MTTWLRVGAAWRGPDLAWGGECRSAQGQRVAVGACAANIRAAAGRPATQLARMLGMRSCQSGETGPWYEKASGPGARSALAGKRLPCNSQPVAGVRRPPHAWHEPIDAQAFAEAEAAFRKSCLALKITCCAPLRRVSVASIAACEPARPLALASHVCAGGTSAALPSAPPAPQGIRAELRVLRGSEPPRWLRALRAQCRRSRAPKNTGHSHSAGRKTRPSGSASQACQSACATFAAWPFRPPAPRGQPHSHPARVFSLAGSA